jgi:hypothetical protein
MMVQTFSYRTETKEKAFYHTIHSVDIRSSIDKWIRQIEDFQNKVYSFDANAVENIKQQYLSGQLNVNIDKEPYFLTYKIEGHYQVVNIDKVNKGEPDFIARVTYLTTQEGGRTAYAASGYRPHVKFEGRKELTSGEQLFIEKEKVFPGETATAEIRIVTPHFFKNYLFVGQPFEFGEGPRVIGHGEVLEIINRELQRASR